MGKYLIFPEKYVIIYSVYIAGIITSACIYAKEKNIPIKGQTKC